MDVSNYEFAKYCAMVQESFWDFLPMAIMDINGTNNQL